MMITDLKNGLLAHLLLHELMNTRDESIINKVHSALMLWQPTYFHEGEVRSVSRFLLYVQRLVFSRMASLS